MSQIRQLSLLDSLCTYYMQMVKSNARYERSGSSVDARLRKVDGLLL